jgi:hypothetical protein
VGLESRNSAAPVRRPSSNTLRWDVDFQYTHAGGYSLYGAFQGDYMGARGAGPGPLHRTDIGALLEGGYFICPSVQLVGRYDFVTFDGNFKSGGRELFQEAGIGANWYLKQNGSWGNHAKVTVDVNYLPFGNPGLAGLDHVASPRGHDAIVLRTQFQFWI